MENFHFILCFSLIVSSLMVSLAKNPINSVIYLIVCFFNSAFLLFFFSIEFLSLTHIIIYVGAIAVLFLFVIMMLNIKEHEQKTLEINVVLKKVFLIVIIYTLFLFLFFFFVTVYSHEPISLYTYRTDSFVFLDEMNNIDILGQFLFNYLSACILLSGLILLIALVGSIVLVFNFTYDSNNSRAIIQLSKSHNILIYFR